MQKGNSAGEWPLVGRAEELAFLRRLRRTGPGTSAFISGEAGTGKSRLAHEALDEAAREGWATLALRGSVGYAGIPLGPFRTVLELGGSSDLTELSEAAVRRLEAMRSAQGLLLLADDCQDVDAMSAALLHQLVAAGSVVVLVTTRTGTQAPAAITSIWKDGLAERFELHNLSQLETTDLLTKGLGGAVQDSSANQIWQVTAGNPLYLREVVLSSLETDALKAVDGEWRWRGAWATGTRLKEIVAARMGGLDPDELTAMELLALASPLPVSLLSALTTASSLTRLEAHGLVETERSDGRLEVAIAQPLHAEVLRGAMPALRRQSMRRTLVEALRATAPTRTADRVRLACWSLELGDEVDPVTLALGADATLFRIGAVISARLDEILPDADRETSTGGLAVPLDHDMAIRMARAAYEQSGGLGPGIALASALAWTGATVEAEAVLAELTESVEVVEDRVRLAIGLAWVRFWRRYDVEEARAGLLDAVTEAEASGVDALLLAHAYEQLAGIALNTAQPAAALAYAERCAAAQGVELGHSVAAAVAAASLAYLGRCHETLAFVQAAVPPALERGDPLVVPQLLVAQAAALSLAGELEQARQLMEWLRGVALDDGLLDASSVFGVVLGEILLRQGCAGSAARIFQDSCGLLTERDLFGYRSWALAGLARARALCGEPDSAAVLLDDARGSQAIGRHYDMSLFLAEVELHRVAGRTDAAVAAARAAVAWARDAGMAGYEAQALESWWRTAPSDEVAARLGELVALTDSALVAALAAYARAGLASDAEALLAVADRFGAMGAWWLAAEAAAAAVATLAAAGSGRAASSAARTATGYAERCDGGRPVIDATAGPVRLTKREREVAALVVAGNSTKEIAARLYLSPRTVENHLHRAYTKLGVADRAALAGALAPEGVASVSHP
ncbi:MAG TPA: LuxR C-terminal-related transcriptional regulator [Acidimicrobiales bacterium]